MTVIINGKPVLAVFSGAGLSAESGIPTFRTGAGALWEGHSIQEVCTFSTWRDNRAAVHRFYNARRKSCETAEPNAAHYALADWQKRWGALMVTQNVDNLLERAGCTDVLHLHGSLTRMHCTACGHKWDIGYSEWDAETGTCPFCFSVEDVKPDVVFFGEIAEAYDRLYEIIRSLTAADTAVVMGTGCAVVPFDLHLSVSACYKAINSLNPIEELGKRVLIFDNVLGMPASQAVQRLEPTIRLRMSAGSAGT